MAPSVAELLPKPFLQPPLPLTLLASISFPYSMHLLFPAFSLGCLKKAVYRPKEVLQIALTMEARFAWAHAYYSLFSSFPPSIPFLPQADWTRSAPRRCYTPPSFLSGTL